MVPPAAARHLDTGFIRGDHGYWGAQLVEPYVDEDDRDPQHQVLRLS
jgi:hypothetical protein